MDYIQRLPFLLGAIMAMIIGVFSYQRDTLQSTYIKMAIGMLVFFIIGVYIRNTFMNLNEEVEIKRLEQEEEERRKQQEKKKVEGMEGESASNDSSGKNIDLIANDPEDDFLPFPVSDVIEKEKKE